MSEKINKAEMLWENPSGEYKTITVGLGDYTRLTMPNGRVFIKEFVTRETIGTVFYLIGGMDHYPTYNDFKECKTDKQLSHLSFEREYNGWAKEGKLNMLKVLHLICYMSSESHREMEYTNNYLAHQWITQSQAQKLMDKIYYIPFIENNFNRFLDLMREEFNQARDIYYEELIDPTVCARDLGDNSGSEYMHCREEVIICSVAKDPDSFKEYLKDYERFNGIGWKPYRDIKVDINSYIGSFGETEDDRVASIKNTGKGIKLKME